jgi:glyoxylase-like metal-dependent hydrolase (beta-lactamase superfamily II)
MRRTRLLLLTLAPTLLMRPVTATPAAVPPVAVRLYALDCGTIEVADMAMFSDTGEHAGEPGTLAAPCFLVRHPHGDLLWDTGLGDRLAALPDGEAVGGGIRLRVRTTLVAQLARLGLGPADIRFVGFSHLHADHTGNAGTFTASTWLLNAAELPWALGTPTPIGVDTTLLAGRRCAHVEPLAGDYDVFGDGTVRILHTPGHTPGHQLLLIRLAHSGAVILSGDLFHTRENYEKALVPPTNVSRAETLASADRIARILRATHARLIVQHDVNDFRALPAFPRYLE